MIRRSVMTLGFMFVALVAACNCQTKKSFVVRKILVDRVAEFADSDKDLQPERLQALVQEVIAEEALIRVAKRKNEGGVLRVRIERWDNFEAEPVGYLITARFSEQQGDRVEDYYGIARLSAADIRLRDNFKAAVREGIQQILAERFSESTSSELLLARLNRHISGFDVPRDRLIYTIQLIGARREKAAIKPLLVLLQKKDQRISSAALAALSLIGDASAVDPVIKFAERKPAQVRKQAILAVRAMGGERAAAWLFTMSTGYDDPEVQQAAAEALKYVEKNLKSY